MAAVERVAVWMNSTDHTLILNSDGRLLERTSRRGKYTLVRHSCNGVDALMYAVKKDYALVGTHSPQEFIAPEPTEGNKMATATKKESKQDLYFNFVSEIMASEQISAKAAFEKAAEHFKTTPGNVSTAYYRMKREAEGTISPADKTRGSYAVNRLAVPEELINILPILRAGLDAFERTIAWAEAKQQELNERESTIEAREQEAKKRIQEQLNTIFA